MIETLFFLEVRLRGSWNDIRNVTYNFVLLRLEVD